MRKRWSASPIDVVGLIAFIIVMMTISFQVWNNDEPQTAITVLAGLGVSITLYIMVLVYRMTSAIIKIDKRQSTWELHRREDVLNAEIEVSEQSKERIRVRARDDRQDDQIRKNKRI